MFLKLFYILISGIPSILLMANKPFNQIHLFMRNKPNFQKPKTSINHLLTKTYENKSRLALPENKPNQTQSSPGQEQTCVKPYHLLLYLNQRRAIGVTSHNKKAGDVMASTKDFWQDTRTGKIYAVESTTFGKIVGAAGPFELSELGELDDYDYKPAIVDWLEKAVAEHRLRRINRP
jgi:hypothetical protein